MEFDKIYKFPDFYYSIKNSINRIYVNLIHNPSTTDIQLKNNK